MAMHDRNMPLSDGSYALLQGIFIPCIACEENQNLLQNRPLIYVPKKLQQTHESTVWYYMNF